jgi:hypothetical protein
MIMGKVKIPKKQAVTGPAGVRYLPGWVPGTEILQRNDYLEPRTVAGSAIFPD